MMGVAAHGSQTWSTPWQELHRKLALGIRIESPQQSALAPKPESRAQPLTANSWLRRARSRLRK
jgi:hypothetical protein